MQLFSIREAANALSVSEDLIYKLCRQKKIRHERHGLGRGTIRISQEALDEYRKGVTVRAEGPAAEQAPPRKKIKLRHLEA